MKGQTIAYRVIELCSFPADFTGDDKEKFALEVSAEAGRYLPDGDLDSIVEEVTGTSRTLTVKFGKTVHKAGKGEKIDYSFRLSVVLAISAALKIQKVTGFVFPVNLAGKDTFWKNWKRAAEVAEPAN